MKARMSDAVGPKTLPVPGLPATDPITLIVYRPPSAAVLILWALHRKPDSDSDSLGKTER